MTFTAAVTQTPQHSFLNGGTGVESRQYSARPTQHTPNGPRITPGIAGMVPGEFRTIWPSSENQLFSVQNEVNGLWYNGLDWTPRAAWSATTQQIVIGMRRGTYKVVAYSDITGEWRELPVPKEYGRSTGGTAHFYGLIDDRPDGTVYLASLSNTDFIFDPVAETYQGPLSKHLVTNGGNGAMVAHSDDLFGGSGGVIKYIGDAKRWLAYSYASDTWELRAHTLPHGAHALLEYNPTAQRYLLVGGTLTAQKATLVTEAGVVTPVTDAPQPVAMSSGSWIAYHPAGCWLVRCWPDTGPGKLYACWPNAAKTDVVWQDLGVAPDNGLTYSTAAVDYDRGMIYIVSTTGLHAYKLPEVTDPSGAIDLSGAALSTATAAGTLTTSVQLAGAAASLSAASGALTAQITLSGAALAQAAATAALTAGTADLAGDAVALATALGTLTVQIRLAGDAVAQSIAAADLSTESAGLSGAAQASATGMGLLGTAIPLAGQATATAAASGSLGVPILLSGAAAAVSSATGELTLALSLEGHSLATALASGSLTTAIPLSGAAIAQALASGALAGTALITPTARTWRVRYPVRLLRVRT